MDLSMGIVVPPFPVVPAAVVYTLGVLLPDCGIRSGIRILNYILSGHAMYIYAMFGVTSAEGGLAGALITAFFCLSGIIAAGVAYIIGFKDIKIIQPWLDQWKKN